MKGIYIVIVQRLRKIIFALIVLGISTTTAMAQAPEAFNYSGIARNNWQVIANSHIGLQLSIVTGSANGTALYTETQSTTTDTAGYFSVSVGRGVSTDTFANINWGSGTYFLKVGIDTGNGNSYVDIGTTQLLSVPFALYAKNSGGISNKYSNMFYATDSVFVDDTLFHIGSTWYVANYVIPLFSFSNGKFYLPDPTVAGSENGYILKVVGTQLALDYASNDSNPLTSFNAIVLPNNTIQLTSFVITITSNNTYVHKFTVINP